MTERRPGLVIAIDGPSSSGKSTAGMALAGRLGLHYVDTGAMYRAVGLLCLRKPDPEAAMERAAELVAGARIDPRWDGEQFSIYLDGEDVTRAVRQPEVSGWASRVSAIPEVRSELVAQQRRLAANQGVVMDGRDIGTVVLPDADLKFYLIASLEERGRRRAAEEAAPDPATVTRDLDRRDRNDSTRSVSPLKAAEDAVTIDTTKLTPEQVVQTMLDRIQAA